MTKYIEINGTRYDLNEFGQAALNEVRILGPATIQALGLEIKEDAPKWAIVNENGTTIQHNPDWNSDVVTLEAPTSYAEGLKRLALYAGIYYLEIFELRKDGVVVATLKGENA